MKSIKLDSHPETMPLNFMIHLLGNENLEVSRGTVDMNGSPNSGRLFAALFGLVFLAVFQNCSSGIHSNQPSSSSSSSTDGGGTGGAGTNPTGPSMIAQSLSINEGTTGISNVTLVNAQANSDFTLLWEILTTGGTTATTSDFTNVSGFVSVPGGVSSIGISLTSVKDNLYGVPNKVFTLRIREAASRMATIDVQVTVVQDPFSASITSAQDSSCAAINGVAKCWGSNAFGQLGNGNNNQSNVPVAVAGFPAGTSVKQISLGGQEGGGAFGCAVLNTGAVYCWGQNNVGQLGNATNVNRNTAGPTTGLDSGVSAVTTGLSHACAIKNGALYCWGLNNFGQLGLGDQINRSAPTLVPAFSAGVTAVSAGGQFTCVIYNGGAKCFGAGTSGQLGNAANISSFVPVDVSGGTIGVTQISAGTNHACAIIAGAAKCWGANGNGQLGDNTGAAKNVATQVTGLIAGSGVTAISAARAYTCALVNGVPQCWGINDNNQLGDSGGHIVPTVASPVLGAGFVAIATAFEGQQTCAVKPPANIHCWGEGDSGQLGSGQSPSTAFPTAAPLAF